MSDTPTPQERRAAWVAFAAATATNENFGQVGCGQFADAMLNEYDKRFPGNGGTPGPDAKEGA